MAHSTHRVVSDLSTFVAKEDKHRVLAAGDLNTLRGYGEYGDDYWAGRYKTVFDRMEAMGLPCVGPEYLNGWQADPWPTELPRDSRNVPTFHHSRQSPETVTCQLDYVFTSTKLIDALTVRALNTPEEWGQATIAGSRLNLQKESDHACARPRFGDLDGIDTASQGGGQPSIASWPTNQQGSRTWQLKTS